MRLTMNSDGACNHLSQITDSISDLMLDENTVVNQGVTHTDHGSMNVDNSFGFSKNILILTNVSEQIFDHEFLKKEFESLFTHLDPGAKCHYLRSFRRVRVTMTSDALAAEARACVHNTELCGDIIQCFYARPIVPKAGFVSPTLHPPVPEKQFLISPPASPPVGWEPILEGEPVINYDLLHAIANLAPGQAHELHPPSTDHPGIVVHICEDPEGYGVKSIEQTRRPRAT